MGPKQLKTLYQEQLYTPSWTKLLHALPVFSFNDNLINYD